jgi:hypothetical protein
MPFVISVACFVGNFKNYDCFCEVSVSAGTENQPKGFIAHWGSTIPQSWVPPTIGQMRAVRFLINDISRTAGGIVFQWSMLYD